MIREHGAIISPNTVGGDSAKQGRLGARKKGHLWKFIMGAAFRPIRRHAELLEKWE